MGIKAFIFPILLTANFVNASESWLGKYTYGETYNSEKFIIFIYEVTIYSEGSQLKAEVRENGFQTGIHLKCNLLESKNSVRFVVSEVGADNLYSPYAIGEPLFELRQDKSKLVTRWLHMKPLKPENQKIGKYFEKLSVSENK